jgi:hypothetical protein
MTISKLAFIEGDAKAIGVFIDDTLSIYQKTTDYLVYAGAISFYHAAEHGDPVFLNRLFKGLTKGHQNMFRAWVGKLCTFEADDKRDQWLKMHPTDGFIVKTGTEPNRKGKYVPADLIANGEWMKREKPEEVILTDEQVIAGLYTGVVKKVDGFTKAWVDAGVPVPFKVEELIKKFKADLLDIAQGKATPKAATPKVEAPIVAKATGKGAPAAPIN